MGIHVYACNYKAILSLARNVSESESHQWIINVTILCAIKR